MIITIKIIASVFLSILFLNGFLLSLKSICYMILEYFFNDCEGYSMLALPLLLIGFVLIISAIPIATLNLILSISDEFKQQWIVVLGLSIAITLIFFNSGFLFIFHSTNELINLLMGSLFIILGILIGKMIFNTKSQLKPK